MRYVIYGAGAVGGTIGARLFESGRDVLLIARGAHYEAIRSDGLRYGDPDSTRTLRVPVVDHPARVDWRDGDVAILAMKGQGTSDALAALEEFAPAVVPVVCAQNGVENERAALRVRSDVYAMVVMMPATHLEPGAVDADSLPIVGVLDVGRYPAGVDPLVEEMAEDLSASGFRSTADPDIMRWKYQKLLANLATAMRAMCGPESGDDEASASARSVLTDALRNEALDCYAHAGVSLPSTAEVQARWGGAVTPKPIEGRPRVAGSGWQSLARGLGSIESDFINGEIALLGRLHGVPTPVNELVRRRSGEVARALSAPGSVSILDLAVEAGLG